MAKQTTVGAQIDAYYNTLDELAKQYAAHEGAVSVAFQSLLADTARRHHWTLIPQLSAKGIRPDGTLKDPMGLVRGHWEAKDTDDNLDAEICKKNQKGYPLGNIIFEDTRVAVLFQNKTEVMRIELRDRERLARLLQAFFDYVEPQIESFGRAVDEFKERVPDIAKHLKQKIVDAHATNKKFKEAYASFIEMCRTALNPGIQQDAVDDMLVQHLLTERLIREIFDISEFTRRNAIAVEIEKVIDALTSKSFDRHVFLKSLDRFYVAIENAAHHHRMVGKAALLEHGLRAVLPGLQREAGRHDGHHLSYAVPCIRFGWLQSCLGLTQWLFVCTLFAARINGPRSFSNVATIWLVMLW